MPSATASNSGAPSRKSILAGIRVASAASASNLGADVDALSVHSASINGGRYVSNTDAVLMQQRMQTLDVSRGSGGAGETEGRTSSSSARRKSMSSVRSKRSTRSNVSGNNNGIPNGGVVGAAYGSGFQQNNGYLDPQQPQQQQNGFAAERRTSYGGGGILQQPVQPVQPVQQQQQPVYDEVPVQKQQQYQQPAPVQQQQQQQPQYPSGMVNNLDEDSRATLVAAGAGARRKRYNDPDAPAAAAPPSSAGAAIRANANGNGNGSASNSPAKVTRQNSIPGGFASYDDDDEEEEEEVAHQQQPQQRSESPEFRLAPKTIDHPEEDDEEEDEQPQQSQGYLAKATGALAGVGAVAGGAVGAVAGALRGRSATPQAEEQPAAAAAAQEPQQAKAPRRRYAREEESEEEEVEQPEEQQRYASANGNGNANAQHQRKHTREIPREEREAQRLAADEEELGGYVYQQQQQGNRGAQPVVQRHRGQSAPPHALAPHHDDDDDYDQEEYQQQQGYQRQQGRQAPAPRQQQQQQQQYYDDRSSTAADSTIASSGRPGSAAGSAYSGAAAGKRPQRAASINSTSTGTGANTIGRVSLSEGKMRKETPEYVRTKAANVARLKFDDVNQTEEEMIADIRAARGALHLFLNSQMIEAEEIIKEYADKKMYYALGAGLIAVIKGFMTFESEDLAVAVSFCKDTIHFAQLLRKPTNAVSNFGRFVRGTGQSPSAMASMTFVQRHAELIFAEATLLKAVMGILYSGDFFGFMAEALNMRTAYGIYRSLQKYVDWADEQAAKKSRGAIDESIDEDFRSGVYLGNGLISMILGLLPGKVLKIMEVFGYGGDCVEALKILAKAGEWSPNPKHTKPGMPLEEEGIRRPICDMSILLYNLVISTFMPVNGVDIAMADKILHYNLDRYPQGVFFLYFSGRLYSTQSLSEKAIKQFIKARDCQREYIQLQHISLWELSLCNLSLAQWVEVAKYFDTLLKDSNWSKAVYNYGRGACLYEAGGVHSKEAAKVLPKTKDLMQRIAGKSIPLEKFAARKSQKFMDQGRLLLPGIEFSYFYHCISNAPRYILADEHLVTISQAMRDIHEHERNPKGYHSGEDEYWDDYCLAHFLRAVTLRYIAHPEPFAKPRPRESPIPEREAEEQAEMSLKNVISNGHKLTTDHYLIYFAHYELGRLYASMGRDKLARDEFNLILSGKNLGDKGRKGKYSMQNMCLLRSNGALNALDERA